MSEGSSFVAAFSDALRQAEGCGMQGLSPELMRDATAILSVPSLI